jgi:hypothetical protein
MTHDLLESISQRISGTEDAENCRIYEVANELYRRCRLYESELRKGEKYVRASDIERIITEESQIKNLRFGICYLGMS